MPKKMNPDSRPSDKLLVLYQRLVHSGRAHFQADIARDLDCSPQTVSRLVDVIEDHLGRDTFLERGLDGRRRFYRIVTNSQSKGLGFSFEELYFLAVCRDLAAPHLPDSVLDRIGHTLTDLALILGERSHSTRNLDGSSVGFRSKGYIDYGPHMDTMAHLRTAIKKRQICQVLYTAGGQAERKSYRYAPGQILVMGGTIYVQGFRVEAASLMPDRPTTFSLHRISSIAPTGEYFNFDAAKGEARAFGLDWHKPKRMHVHIAPQAADYVRDRIWSEDQELEVHSDDSITLSVTTASEKELQAWVWSFGGEARIVQMGMQSGK